MAVTSGFFPSQNHDRQYDNMDVGRMFDGVILDGVFSTIGNAFLTQVSSGMDIVVGTGRAWFDHTWTINDSNLILTVSANNTANDRYDYVCVKVDTVARENSIVIVPDSGRGDGYGHWDSNINSVIFVDPSANGIYYHPLALIRVKSQASAIATDDIIMWIGTGNTRTPYVKAAVDNIDITTLMAEYSLQFMTWWNNLQDLGQSEGAVLQGEIADLRTDLTAETTARTTRDTQLTENGNNILSRTTVTKNYTIGANATIELTFPYTLPEGYTYLGVVAFDSGSSKVCITHAGKKSDNNGLLALYNPTNSSISNTAKLTMAFIKTNWNAPT